MKKILCTPSVMATLGTCLFLIYPLSVFAAGLSSMLNLGTQQNGFGETVSIVEVKCTSLSSSPRVIFSIEGKRAWCSQDIPNLCSRDKVSAAIKVCRNGFMAKVREYKSSLETDVSTGQINSPLSENAPATVSAEGQTDSQRIAAEKQRIQIERGKLEVRRQELEAMKQRLELERQSAD
ncbi:hypothetical protein N9060_00280 [Arenicella sp.]|nr:hypothetical protein [Arenicella sp.]